MLKTLRQASAPVESKDYEPIHEMNLATGHYRIVAGALDPPPHLATILGDAVQNYRAALEHLVRAVVVENLGGSDPPGPLLITFPLNDRPEQFDKRKVLPVSTPRTASDSEESPTLVQRGTKKHSLLEQVRVFSDVDKHRKLSLLAHAASPDHDPLVGEPAFENCGTLIEPYYVIGRRCPSSRRGTRLVLVQLTHRAIEGQHQPLDCIGASSPRARSDVAAVSNAGPHGLVGSEGHS